MLTRVMQHVLHPFEHDPRMAADGCSTDRVEKAS
jgi:hypothetical protein